MFAPKVRYWAFNVKLRKLPKTALMTFDLHHIHIIGKCGQGQHTLMTSRSRSQGHKGQILSPPPPPIFRPSTADMLVIFLTTLTSLVTLNFYLRSPKYPWPHFLTLDRTFPLNVNLEKSICLCSCIQSFWWPWPWKSSSKLTFLYRIYKSLWCIHLSIN